MVGPSAPATYRGLSGVSAVAWSGHFAGNARGGQIQFVGQFLCAVVGLRNGVGVEGVGLDDVGAGVQIRAMDGGDDVWLGQAEQVVVALQAVRVIGKTFAAKSASSSPKR